MGGTQTRRFVPDEQRHPEYLAAARPDWYAAVWDLKQTGATVRVVRGDRCATPQGLFDEFAAALQFPLYLGQNWNAFDECLSDETYAVEATNGFLLVITDPAALLTDSPERLTTFVEICRDATRTWNRTTLRRRRTTGF